MNDKAEVVNRPIINQVNIDALTLCDRLQAAEVGEVVTYAELSELIKRDVQRDARYVLASAQKRLQRDNRILFGAVRGVGIKRLNDEETVRVGATSMTKIRREARRGMQKTACANFDALSDEGKVQHNTSLSMLGALHLMTTSRKIKALKETIKNTGGKLSLGRTLELFQGSKKEE